MMTLMIDTRGGIRCVYAEHLDLAAIGAMRISRASHVEPDETGHWWADIIAAAGPVLGPFDRRSEALAAERRWLEENLLSVAMASGEPSHTSDFLKSINESPHGGGSPRHQPEGEHT